MTDDFGAEMEKKYGVDKLPTKKEYEAQAKAERLRGMTGIGAVDSWLEWMTTLDEQGVSTGWKEIDDLLEGGIRPGEVVLLAARAGVGKSWGLQQWAMQELDKHPDLCVLFLTFEMSSVHLGERLAVHAMKVGPPSEIRRKARLGELTAEHVHAGAPHLERMCVNENTIKLEEIPDAIAAAEEMLGGVVGIVCIDYLGLLRSVTKSGRIYEAVSEVSRGLKSVAKECGIVVLAAAQLSREGGGSGFTEPFMDSLRDSGVTEEAADRILMMWQVEKLPGDPRQYVRAKVAKNRFGPTSNFYTTLMFTDAMLLEPSDEYDVKQLLVAYTPPDDIPF